MSTPLRATRAGLGLLLLLSACATVSFPPAGRSATVRVDSVSGGTITHEGDWITFTRGRDESLFEMRVRIWGTERDSAFFEHGFGQLDQDDDREYLIISRNAGSGAYYQVQILDPTAQGVLVLQHESHGRPRILRGSLELGVKGPRGVPVRRRFVLREGRLVGV